MDKQNLFNISAEGIQFILSTFSCLILKLKSPRGTSFGLYFAFEEFSNVVYANGYPNSLLNNSKLKGHSHEIKVSLKRGFFLVKGKFAGVFQ